MNNHNHFEQLINKKLVNFQTLEMNREKSVINLIASENFASPAVLELTGSIFTNKYAEGYPGHRYYAGCEVVDQVETYAQELLKQIFNCDCQNSDCYAANAHANVQLHSGSQANTAAYAAVLTPGDTILGMDLLAGGHLTHGYKVNFSGKIYHAVSYGVVAKTGEIDYKQVRKLALKYHPKAIIAGASAYSLIIDYAKFRAIADEVGAYLIADIAHIAGLIVAKVHPTPVCYADIITSTTHKTLRGPRGAFILCTSDLAKKVDSAVFPGNQGGPLEHVIAAKAQAFYEATQPEFILYQQQVVKNAAVMAEVFAKHGLPVVAKKTENHLFTVNTKDSFLHLTGKEASERLACVNIITNKNTVPNDSETPFVTSGVRFGTPAMTTRGFKEGDFKILAHTIIKIWSMPKAEFNKKIYILQEQVMSLLDHLTFYQINIK